jgi:heme-degrading monooxygenase HmoA
MMIRPSKPATNFKREDGKTKERMETMVVRMWKATSTRSDRADDYIRHATKTVFPKIHAIKGNRGEYLLRRNVEGGVELVVLTLWESMEAVRRFAGPDPNKAVVEPEARSLLTSFDENVIHYEVIHRV